jgi:hypothetical protein
MNADIGIVAAMALWPHNFFAANICFEFSVFYFFLQCCPDLSKCTKLTYRTQPELDLNLFDLLLYLAAPVQ